MELHAKRYHDAFPALKEKQRRLRDGFPENVGLHIHRALSWLNRAEKEAGDPDAAFVFFRHKPPPRVPRGGTLRSVATAAHPFGLGSFA